MTYWHKSMNEETARRVLGDKHFEFASPDIWDTIKDEFREEYLALCAQGE